MQLIRANLIAYFLLFAIGVLAGHYVLPGVAKPLLGSLKTDTQEGNNKYTYINPLLFCSDQDISNYTNSLSNSLEDKLRDYVTTEESKGDLTEASVYYKDLNEGPWVLIHGSMRTVPASLLKVPIALALYKHAESNPSFLDKTFTLNTTDNVNIEQHFAPAAQVAPNVPYTIKQLTKYMLADSDNGALFLLGSSLPNSEFIDAYSDLGIDPPTEVAPGYTMDAKTYSSFFRVLYNASYLDNDDSEYLLGILAQSTFPHGLEAGVPKGTVVAHKFGEFTVAPDDLRLQDCGIVYKPHAPYLLCVLTRGKDFDKLAQVIANISNITYSSLTNQ